MTPINPAKPAVLFLRKPPGVTSFAALHQIKKLYGRQVGHTGTLDKFAEGLLIVLVGKMTRFASIITDLDKVYEAEIVFGQQTSTLDPEGEVVQTAELPTADTVRRVLPSFLGRQSQVPPEYSAIHVQGKRAYERVLAGEKLDLPAREIEIFSMELLSLDLPRLTVRVHCSKGTYIRSLARDLAVRCGSVGSLTKLKRSRIGGFDLPTGADYQEVPVLEFLQKLGLPLIITDQGEKIRQGKPLEKILGGQILTENQPTVLVSPESQILAVVTQKQDRLSYNFVV